jgi:N-acetylmuramoyl-L-alanine amidase
MPAILVETAFVSNPAEARKLADSQYRAQVAKAIWAGIKAYTAMVSRHFPRQARG